MTDILLDENDDLLFDANGELVLGDCDLQEVGIIARINKGEVKSDPLLGPNLIELINANGGEAEVKQRMKIALARDGKNYDEYRDMINLKTTE
ncbi:MAG: hypothetical protein JJE55_06830 [Flavobacteriaceae bacterium]|nr:hypothetical protein [Flavobacteriaceae bacterium]